MLSTQVPAPIVLSTYPTRASKTPTQASKFTTGQVTVSPSLNENAVYLDQLARFGGSNLASVCSGLGISAGSGLQALCAVGIGNCNGIIEITSQLFTALQPSATNFLWLLTSGAFTNTTTNASPASFCIYLGAAITNSTGVTSIDTSGVLYDLGGATVRTCSDSGAPADTPPNGCWFITKTTAGTYIWDGGAYRQILAPGTLTAVDNVTIDYNGSTQLEVKAIPGSKITSGTISADYIAVDGTTIEDNGSHELQVIGCPASGLTGTITDAQLTTSYIKADGTRAFTGDADMGSHKITNLANPVAGTDAVNLSYMQSLLNGLSPHQAVRLATAAALPVYMVSGTAPNFTLTANANGALTVDGASPVTGDRILVQHETGGNAVYNLIYAVTQPGSGSTPWILQVASDSNSLTTGAYTVASSGTVNANQAFVLDTSGTITIGTTSLSWALFASLNAVTAGAAVSISGTTLSVVYDNATIILSGSNQLEVGTITDANVAAANKDGLAATPSMRTLGTGAQQACAGDDSRLTPLTAGSAIQISSGTVSAEVDTTTIEVNGSNQLSLNSSYLCGLIEALA